MLHLVETSSDLVYSILTKTIQTKARAAVRHLATWIGSPTHRTWDNLPRELKVQDLYQKMNARKNIQNESSWHMPFKSDSYRLPITSGEQKDKIIAKHFPQKSEWNPKAVPALLTIRCEVVNGVTTLQKHACPQLVKLTIRRMKTVRNRNGAAPLSMAWFSVELVHAVTRPGDLDSTGHNI